MFTANILMSCILIVLHIVYVKWHKAMLKTLARLLPFAALHNNHQALRQNLIIFNG